MEKVKAEEAVGKVLGSDVTDIIPGVRKGPLFKRGHIIKEEDIEKLLSIGKHYVWILGKDEGFVNEDDAANEMMQALKGKNLYANNPSESIVKLFAEKRGVVTIDTEGLREINKLKDPRIAVVYNFSFVEKNAPVALGKVMPLEIPISEMAEIKRIAEEHYPIINLLPLKKHKIAIFPVGNEFIEGRRKETMSFNVMHYLEEMGQNVFLRKVLPDDASVVKQNALSAIDNGADIVIYMGGMAVDPDDRTTEGIKEMGVDIVTYGVPMWPGITFLISYKNGKVVLGIPGAAGLAKSGTSFHRIMPIILADYTLSKEEIVTMGEGGFINAKNL